MQFGETIQGVKINTVEPDSTETQEQPQPAGIILERHHLAAAGPSEGLS